MPDLAPPSSASRFSIAAIIVSFVVLLAFVRVVGHDFVSWDDSHNIVANPLMNPVTVDGIAFFWGHKIRGLYIPITYTLWAFIAPLARIPEPGSSGALLSPLLFHLVNLLLHLGSALTVLALLRKLKFAGYAAAFGALLFALHPVQVESVAWISGMKDVLSGLLALVALWQYVSFLDAASPRREWHYRIATLAFVLAMLSKPSAVTTPLIALLLGRLLGRSTRELLDRLTLWFFAALVCAYVARVAQTSHASEMIALWQRPLIAADALDFYLYKLFAPLNLAFDYGRSPSTVIAGGLWTWTWIAPVTLAVALWLTRRRALPIAIGAGIAVAAVVPVLGFTPFEFQFYSTVSDHYLYLAMLGPALAGAWVVSKLKTRAARTASAVVIAGCFLLTFRQTATWADDQTLFAHALRINPDSAAANTNLGLLFTRRDDPVTARSYFERAIRGKPADDIAQENLAFTLTNLALVAGDVAAREQLFDEATACYERTIKLRESPDPKFRRNTATTHYRLGCLLQERGRHAEAESHFSISLSMNPFNTDARLRLEQVKQKLPSPTSNPTPRL